MKVKDLIADLQTYDGSMEVKFAMCPSDELEILSMYPSRDEKTLWVDIGDEESEAEVQGVMVAAVNRMAGVA